MLKGHGEFVHNSYKISVWENVNISKSVKKKRDHKNSSKIATYIDELCLLK